MLRPNALGMVLAMQLALGGCETKQVAASDQSGVAVAATQASDSLAPVATQVHKVPVPAGFIGNWRLTSIECEKDSDERPPKHLPQVFLHIDEDGTWYIDVEGFPMRGDVEVHPVKSGPEIRLTPGALDFHIRDGRLVNDSEGDAPYLCERIFGRDRT